MGKYFGTDGFRGEANINLTVEHAYKVGRYIGWYFNQKSSSRAKMTIFALLVELWLNLPPI